MTDKNLSIYIHIPYCKQKCLYCDFMSGTGTEEQQREYVSQLIEDIRKEAINYIEYQIVSIFIGGGTPSILPISEMRKIFEALKENYRMNNFQIQLKPQLLEEKLLLQSIAEAQTETSLIEITIEVNPGTVDKAKLEAYNQMGINRLSIGLQSANDEELRNLGRIHTYQDFLKTYQDAQAAGFTNINIDIMSALPGQTKASYEETLIKVCELKPKHISAYSLIIEEGTPFYQMYEDKTLKSKGQLPDEDVERIMYQRTKEILSQWGYDRYEISNYAQKGFECKHNEIYWKRENYLGFGSAAASMVENVRWSNCGEEKQLLTVEEQMSEFMFLGLRRMKGVSKTKFFDLFQKDIEEVYREELQKMKRENFINYEKNLDRISLTERGIDLSNYVFLEFF